MVFERKTIASNKVLEILTNAPHPLGINQIMEQLKQMSIEPNKTTVYRILDKLIQKKVVTTVMINNRTSYYELIKKNHSHHHHFFCTTCHTLYNLDKCLIEKHNIDLSQFLPNKNFEITSHDFNLYGVCEPCKK